MSHEREAIRICPDDQIEAVCLDCLQYFRGTIGVRFIETPEGSGVEVCICTEGKAHAIARIQKHLIPVVEVPSL